MTFFKKFHHEQLPSAIERFVKEVNRVSGVLDGHLARQGQEEHGGERAADGPWLVGNKLSYADIAFISWQTIMTMFLSKDEFNEDDYPHVKEWLGKMTQREAVKKVLESAFKASQG